MLDIGLPPVEAFHLRGIGVKAQDLKSHLAEAQYQGEPHVAQTDDAHYGLFCLDFIEQVHHILHFSLKITRWGGPWCPPPPGGQGRPPHLHQ